MDMKPIFHQHLQVLCSLLSNTVDAINKIKDDDDARKELWDRRMSRIGFETYWKVYQEAVMKKGGCEDWHGLPSPYDV